MDVRILLGMVGVVFVIIVIARLFLFLFGLTLGQYSLLIALAIFMAVAILMVFLVKKLMREQDYSY